MSSIACFYLLSDTVRDEFVRARQNEKTIIRKHTLFGNSEVVESDKFLWEFLDESATLRSDFPHSGFAIIDYLFVFLNLPDELSKTVEEGRHSDHCFTFSASLAQGLEEFLANNAPDRDALTQYVVETGQIEPDGWADALSAAHDMLRVWCSRVDNQSFGVLYLTF